MFFRVQILISALLAVTSVLGAPSAKRQTADPCSGLGDGAHSNVTNFRVAAFNPAGQNPNPYGSQLVQGTMFVSGGVSSTTFIVSETRKWTNTDDESLSMVDGGITSVSPGESVSTQVSDNDVPFFYTSGRTPKPSPAQVWCAVPGSQVPNEHQFDVLAAHGRFDLWSLCVKKFSDTYSEHRIAYNVDKTKPSNSIDVDTCVPVYLTIVPK